MALTLVSTIWIALLTIISPAIAQYPPPVTRLYELHSPINPGVVVRYKTPNSTICHTTKHTQKQFSGYVSLPPGILYPIEQNYPINTFFWFFEARENPQDAPLTIWLNGGPGSSSQIGMWQELGPCEIVPDGDRLKTIPREYGWDRASNILFIDQPNQVGLSFDTPTDGVLPLLSLNRVFIPGAKAPENGGGYMHVDLNDPESILEAMNKTNLLDGTFSSGSTRNTANTTSIASVAMWHFLQTWLTGFPQYYPRSKGLHFLAESYGGKFAPSFSAYMEEQNIRRAQGHLPPTTLELHLESVGIINGCIDNLIQSPYYPIYAHSNPYGIEAISTTTRNKALRNYFKPNGCKDLLIQCKREQQLYDPESIGNNILVNTACRRANRYCGLTQLNPYMKAGRGVYDIAHKDPDPFPPNYHLEYLNTARVQEAIGAPVNFTQSNTYVFRAFAQTGDMARSGGLDDLSYLLEQGIRVALIYGDRDYICNYMGGEAVSLAVKYEYSSNFASAGYEDIKVNATYIGGQVRQFGNFSFSRVYQSGHLVPAYQPETAFRIFHRLITGKSISDGRHNAQIGENFYSSEGPLESQVALIPPPPPPPMCFLRAITSCTKAQFKYIAEGKAIFENGVFVGIEGNTEKIDSSSEGAQIGFADILGLITGGEFPEVDIENVEEVEKGEMGSDEISEEASGLTMERVELEEQPEFGLENDSYRNAESE